MPRRKKRSRARKKNINVNVIETAGGLIIADQMLGANGAGQVMKGDFAGALNTLATRLRSKDVQKQLLSTGVGVAIVKTAAKSLRPGILGSIGPLKFKA